MDKHEHSWIDITTVNDSGEHRKCAYCGQEQHRERRADGDTEWLNAYEAEQA